MIEENKLSFLYKNYRGEVSKRNVIVTGVVFESNEFHPEPQWIMIAHDLDKNQERRFAINDMKPLENDKRTFNGENIMDKNDLILECMLGMDWKAIHKVFIDNGFTYSSNESPEIEEIQRVGKELLQMVLDKYGEIDNDQEFDYQVWTGRFTAYGYTYNNGNLVLKLEFAPFKSCAILELNRIKKMIG